MKKLHLSPLGGDFEVAQRVSTRAVTILGGGAFGTAMANVLADNSKTVFLWCLEEKTAKDINSKHENVCFLPGVQLNKNVIAVNDFADCFDKSELIFEAIPVKYMRSVLEQTKNFVSTEHVFVALSKGIEQDSLLLPLQIMQSVFGENLNCAVLGGPNFAHELGSKKYSAATVGVKDKKVKDLLYYFLKTDYFKLSFTDDLIGVQIGGAIKNLITLLVGIAKGSGKSENCIAFLITQGLKEIVQLSCHLGGKKETVYDFCGVGDLLLTAMGSVSRNLKAGILIGQGKTFQDLKDNFDVLPEGINTAHSVFQLIEKKNLDLPLCKGVYQIVFQNMNFGDLLR